MKENGASKAGNTCETTVVPFDFGKIVCFGWGLEGNFNLGFL